MLSLLARRIAATTTTLRPHIPAQSRSATFPSFMTEPPRLGKVVEEMKEMAGRKRQELLAKTADERWQDIEKRAMALEYPPVTVPLGPYAGRSIRVKSGNLASALQVFTQRLRQNRVMQDFRYQMRHEKKGVKRRRLQSERWRRQFANVVRQKVQLVHAIRRRGA